MRTMSLVGCVFLVGCGAPPGVEDVQRTSEPLRQCPPAAVEGVDVFDGQGAVDWAAARSAGVAFAFIKATQGTYDTQATFAANWAGSRSAGVLRSAYHFFDPTEDGAAQARHFLSVVGAMVPGDLPAMVDLECPDGDPGCLYAGHAGKAAPADIRARLLAFLGAVEQATHARPVLYTFRNYFINSGVDPSGLDAYPLFLASPSGAGAQGTAAGPLCLDVPAPWPRAAFWQYSWTGRVPGIGADVDRDRFLGDAASLAALGLAGAGPSPGCR
jgi:lysozyme